MAMTDPIADMLTRIRNSNLRGHEWVEVPFSNLKLGIAEIMKKQGFISGLKVVQQDGLSRIHVQLKYDGLEQKCVITGLLRVSRPGLRNYVKKDKIPWVRRGIGIAILSTSKGLLTDQESRRQQVGGEVLCHIW